MEYSPRNVFWLVFVALICGSISGAGAGFIFRAKQSNNSAAAPIETTKTEQPANLAEAQPAPKLVSPLGATCTDDSQCESGNCGPRFWSDKKCLGHVDYRMRADHPNECLSGRFIAGTNMCGPMMFMICGLNLTFWDLRGTTTRTVATTKSSDCAVSDPSRDEVSASAVGSSCTQHTLYTPPTGSDCITHRTGFQLAVWNFDPMR